MNEVFTESTIRAKHFIFIAGLHRSGTSLLHQILRSHPAISGFANTGVPEDEGQHLQSVFLPALAFGGPGRFGFNPEAFMDETHPLANQETRTRLFSEWGRYWDLSKVFLVEKSPPNIVRTRFLQAVFPASTFLAVLRHPLAVAYATRKWAPLELETLLEHTLICYEKFAQDLPFLKRVHVLSYETFIVDPQRTINDFLAQLEIAPFAFENIVLPDMNDKYFQLWRAERNDLLGTPQARLPPVWQSLETRMQAFGYGLLEPLA